MLNTTLHVIQYTVVIAFNTIYWTLREKYIYFEDSVY